MYLCVCVCVCVCSKCMKPCACESEEHEYTAVRYTIVNRSRKICHKGKGLDAKKNHEFVTCVYARATWVFLLYGLVLKVDFFCFSLLLKYHWFVIIKVRKQLDYQTLKGLIIKEWKAWLLLIIKVYTTSLPSFPILPTIHRTNHLLKHTKDGGSVAQKRPAVPLPDTVCAKRNSSTHITSDTTSDKGVADKNIKTSNKNFAQGKQTDVILTVTSPPHDFISINWRSGSKKNQFLIPLMTNSVRKDSFIIGLVVCQDTLMSTQRTLMSIGCGDSSMVTLHLVTG